MPRFQAPATNPALDVKHGESREMPLPLASVTPTRTPGGTGVAHDRQMNPLSSQVAHYGLPFVATNVFLEQLGVPIPAEPTLVIAEAWPEVGCSRP